MPICQPIIKYTYRRAVFLLVGMVQRYNLSQHITTSGADHNWFIPGCYQHCLVDC
ncbi:hypothetical protein PILCRDRAFT_795498 [Piloderma croceum F 1598]|uniref:Uncharacterized protein n=1 Tax=Piloderma croceum (strain F 1598) TaxID=765440 RepID=A0A0C3FCY5_PILCF|nr:hypothetical protein PILCRDRAFT_795498 [Piloderma croceum F 1598]